MAIHVKKQKNNIPKLRFSEFSGTWEEKNLGEIGKFKSGIGFPESEQGGVAGTPFYKVSDMNLPQNKFEMKVSNNYVNKEQIKRKKFKVLKEPSIIFAKVGAAIFLERKRIAQNFIIDNNMMTFTPKGNILFFKYLFDTFRLSKYAQAGALPSYNASDLRIIKTFLPSLSEQQRIADFLGSVDEWIKNLREQKEKLEEYKKGMMQKIFSQQIRFKDDNGKDFPDWKEKKVGDFKELPHGDGDWILSRDISQDGKYKIVQLGNIGLGQYINKDLKTISEDKFKELNGTPIQKGDLLINRMVDNNFYCCIFDKPGDYITSVDVCWIRENIYFDNYFFMSLLLFHDNQNKLLSLSSGSGRVRISKKNLFNQFKFLLPVLPEQQKITNYLSSLDNSIESKQQQVTQAEQWKKGLMQNLFV